MHPELRNLLQGSIQILQQAGVPSPEHDAKELIAHALGINQPLFLVDEVDPLQISAARELIRRRAQREPLQLITGYAPFRYLRLKTRPGVFIPRPETEVALDFVHEVFKPNQLQCAVDLCTGSGTLACAVLDEFPESKLQAVEVDPTALELARENLGQFSAMRWQLIAGDVQELSATEPIAATGLKAGQQLVLSNPPYIPAGMIPRDVEVNDYDPERALFGGGEAGLEVPAAVAKLAAKLLSPNGWFVMEHADVQGAAMRNLLAEVNVAALQPVFADIATLKDLTGRDRFVVARKV